MKSRFEFKNHEYTLKQLITLRSTSPLYQSGEVMDLNYGEVVDIQEIDRFKDRYIVELMDNYSKSKIIKKHSDKELLKCLEKKYLEKTINSDDMWVYINLKKENDKSFLNGREVFSVKYDSFIILNIGEKLPSSIGFPDKGRFYDMLYFLSYNNEMKHSPRKNGRIINKEDLMECLELSNYSSYRRFINKMCKFNIIKELSTSNKTKVIIINPVYVNRNIRIDYTTYLMFKNDLQNFLTDEEIYYLELLGNKDEISCSYEIK